jgi:hypothetical protein
MKFVSSLILNALLSFALCLYLPWWTVAIAAFLVAAFIPQSPGRSFLCGFIGVAILWAVLSISISSRNEHVLAHKVSLLILKTDSPSLLIFVTVLIGALVAGFAALTASFLRKRKA